VGLQWHSGVAGAVRLYVGAQSDCSRSVFCAPEEHQLVFRMDLSTYAWVCACGGYDVGTRSVDACDGYV